MALLAAEHSSLSASDLGLRPLLAVARTPTPTTRDALLRGQVDPDRLLELWINGRPTDIVARVAASPGGLLVEAKALVTAGLSSTSPSANGMVALASLGAVSAEVRDAPQALMLTTRPDVGRLQVIDLAPGGRLSPTSASGLIAGYDLVGQWSRGGSTPAFWSADAALDLTLFTPSASLSSRGWLRVRQGRFGAVRLDSAIQIDRPGPLQHWIVGDTVSSQLQWSRGVRMAGLQVSRDFSLYPAMNTLPTLDVLGSAAAPSNVDVLVNSTRVYSGQVEPGPFELRRIPLVTGQGEAVVVVRDLFGREQVQTLPLYLDASQLARGLTDYSVEVGALRRDYGLSSFSYGRAAALATVRRGLSSRLTAEAHAELSNPVQVLGGGALVRLGSTGAAQASLAGSWGEGRNGLLLSVQARGRIGPIDLFAASSRTFGDYADLASLDSRAVPRSRVQVGANASAGPGRSIGASWIEQRGVDGSYRLAAASFTQSFPTGVQFSALAAFEPIRSGWSGAVFLRVPLGAERSITTSADAAPGRFDPGVAYARRINPDGGLGYSIAASGADQRLQADLGWVGRDLATDAGLAVDRYGVSARASMSGSLVAMGGSVHAARNADGAFALVKTGEPGVTVLRENRKVATTDSRGEALLSDLSPNATNQIGVVIGELPFDAEIAAPTLRVAPRPRSGVVVDFTPPKTSPALVVLRLANGSPVPAGSELELPDGSALPVGFGGEVFVRDLKGAVRGGVLLKGGGACAVSIPRPPADGSDAIPRIGPLACTRGGA